MSDEIIVIQPDPSIVTVVSVGPSIALLKGTVTLVGGQATISDSRILSSSVAGSLTRSDGGVSEIYTASKAVGHITIWADDFTSTASVDYTIFL